MGRELWEVVRVQDLKRGDYVKVSNLDVYPPFEVSSVKKLGTGSFCYEIKPDFGYHIDKMYFSDEGCVFRRVDPTDDSRVLRRALEIASSQLLEAMHAMMERKSPKPSVNDVKHYIDNCISRAVRELESEALDGE